MAVTMNLTLTLDGVTYGELFDFCDAARAAGVPADEKVRCIGSDDKGDRFELDIDPASRKQGSSARAAAALSGQTTKPVKPGEPGSGLPVGRIVESVRSMVSSDEDMEKLIAALIDWRRFLR